MKGFFLQHHEKIDNITSTSLLYFGLVCLLIHLFSFMKNEYIYAFIVVILPFFIISFKQIRNKFKQLLHRVLGFRR